MRRLLDKLDKLILEPLLGKRFYLCVVNRLGTDIYEVNSELFSTREEVEQYKMTLMSTRTFVWVETLTLRCRTDYRHVSGY